MKIPPVKIKSNDLPAEHNELATSLGIVLNPFFDKVVMGFNKNLTIDDNLPFEIRSLDIKVDASGTPISNKTLQTELKNFKGYICINLLDINNTGTYPTASPLAITEVSGFTITIKKIIGLPANVTYRLTLLGIS